MERIADLDLGITRVTALTAVCLYTGVFVVVIYHDCFAKCVMILFFFTGQINECYSFTGQRAAARRNGW